MTWPAPRQTATKDLFRLDGRTILISGGRGAVGKAIGKAILQSGADVVFLDIPTARRENAPIDYEEQLRLLELDNLIRLVRREAEVNGDADVIGFFQAVNVQDEESINAAFAEMQPKLRYPVRGLVNCAAISGESDACDYPAGIFRNILDVNITGTFLIARAAAKLMHDANVTGSIVLFASMSGHISNRGINTSAYNASKAAVHQLARSLAAEWGHPQNTFPGSTQTETNPNPSMEPRPVYPPIRVNTISPGHIDTPLSEAARKRGLTEEWARQNMLGRISVVEEYRAPVLFLLGEGSSYMTGADLRVDGGHCAW